MSVVDDVVRSSDHRPARLDVAGAVEEVEDGKVAALVVAGRRVDPRGPADAERLRYVGPDAHLAVRHRLDVVELRPVARHLDDADGAEPAVAVLGVGVQRVERGDAVDVEGVGVDVGRQRADRDAPDAVVASRQRVRLAVELAGRDHALRVRRAIPQRDAAVGADLGRCEGGTGLRASGGGRRRRTNAHAAINQ